MSNHKICNSCGFSLDNWKSLCPKCNSSRFSSVSAYKRNQNANEIDKVQMLQYSTLLLCATLIVAGLIRIFESYIEPLPPLITVFALSLPLMSFILFFFFVIYNSNKESILVGLFGSGLLIVANFGRYITLPADGVQTTVASSRSEALLSLISVLAIGLAFALILEIFSYILLYYWTKKISETNEGLVYFLIFIGIIVILTGFLILVLINYYMSYKDYLAPDSNVSAGRLFDLEKNLIFLIDLQSFIPSINGMVFLAFYYHLEKMKKSVSFY